MDIGREPGTWMDPRWGASGKRIEFTLDIRLASPGGGGEEEEEENTAASAAALADEGIQKQMVKDNLSGTSSSTYVLQSAKHARLRQGFDKMKCTGGGYRIDNNKKNAGGGVGTLRFFIQTDGTTNENSSYGDISVPGGNLYFSLPIFGQSTEQLSTKEGIVTVRQIGWNTGWRREESRIIASTLSTKYSNSSLWGWQRTGSDQPSSWR